MICELFPFQQQAVNEMRLRVAMALNNYRMLKIPQVVSLQAPTGSGKTIIMSALIEDIFYGSEQFTEQPDAIFVCDHCLAFGFSAAERTVQAED